MSVHKLKDGRYYVEYRHPEDKSKIRREYFGRGYESERKAWEYFNALGLRGYAKRTYDPDRSPSFKELAEGYLSSRLASLEDSTYQVMVYKLQASILPFFGGMEALKITKEHLDKYVVNRLSQGRQASTVAREVTDIQIVMNWAVGRNMISYNPLANFKKPRPSPEIIPPPTIEEIKRIDKYAPEQLKRFLKIIYFTGARPGREVLSLKFSNINFGQNTIKIISAKKHGLKYRDIPLYIDFKKQLEEWYEADGKNPDLHIVNYRKRSIKSLRTSWIRAKELAGITRAIRPYSYRHAFVSMLLDSGADLKSVSELVGHSSVNLTLAVYQHTNKLMHRAAIDKLPKIKW